MRMRMLHPKPTQTNPTISPRTPVPYLSPPTTNNSIALRLLPHNPRLIPNRLRTDPIQTKILPFMQPPLRLAQLLPIQQVTRPEHRAPTQMVRIDGDHPRVLVVQAGKVARDVLCVRGAAVHADEGRADVCLLIEVREAEAREVRELVDDSGLVFGAEAGAEVVVGLGASAVDAVDEGGDGGGVDFRGGRGWVVVGVGEVVLGGAGGG